MIDLYSWPAPNGHKVQILVEELGIPYRLLPIDITRRVQHEASYRAINPNARIPASEVEERSSRDIAKVKYLYMDCRRLAEKQNLTIRSTTKLSDAALGSQALLFAKSRNRLWEFCDPMLAQ